MPFPTTSVIPPDWSSHHRPTLTLALTSSCVITRPAGPGTSTPDGTWTPAPATTIYTGPCRVVPASSERRLVAGEAQETHRRYDIGILWDAPDILVGDQLTVTAGADPQITGRAVRVVDIRYGTEQWMRHLVCDEILGGA